MTLLGTERSIEKILDYGQLWKNIGEQIILTLVVVKMAIYCPQGSGTLRQQLLSIQGIAWYCMVLHGIAW